MPEKIKNLADLYANTKDMRGGYDWFYRGHSNSSWSLLPKAGRSKVMSKNEKLHFESWKRRAVEYIRFSPNDGWDWLSVAQHHGFPTRLLDWSTNPLIAAYFAANAHNDLDGAIYAFQPNSYVKRENIHPLEYEGLSLFRPTAYASRISRQSGVFTIHGPPDKKMVLGGSYGKIKKFEVPACIKSDLLLDLDHFGINVASIFPDLDGLSSHINWVISRRDLRSELIREAEITRPMPKPDEQDSDDSTEPFG